MYKIYQSVKAAMTFCVICMYFDDDILIYIISAQIYGIQVLFLAGTKAKNSEQFTFKASINELINYPFTLWHRQKKYCDFCHFQFLAGQDVSKRPLCWLLWRTKCSACV